MNSHTFSLLATMSTADGRPLILSSKGELAATRKRMAENDCKLAELIAERNRRGSNSTVAPNDVFTCACGEVIANPLDPRMLALHAPHFQAAALARVHEGIER